MFWNYDPDHYERYYVRAQGGRDYCQNCGRIHEWAERWLFGQRTNVQTTADQEIRLTPYEFDLALHSVDESALRAMGLDVVPGPVLHTFGLTQSDLTDAYVVSRVLTFLFGKRAGGVTIEDPRHPKNGAWERCRDCCTLFVVLMRHQVAVERLEARKKIEYWRGLSGKQFEVEFGLLLRNRGHVVERVGGPGDLGVDLVIHTDEGKVIVQCKAHAGKIGPAPVRDLFGSLLHHEAEEAWIVSLEGYSVAAHEFAEGKKIKLLTISDFLE